MRNINSVDEYKTMLVEPCMFIFSSYKSCHPCRLLKKWINTEYSEVDHIYYVDVDNPELSSITDEIYALPTVCFYQDGQVVDNVEGFKKDEIADMIYKLQDSYKFKTSQDETTSTYETTSIQLDTSETDKVSLSDVEKVSVSDVEKVSVSDVDKVLEELGEKVKNY